MSNEYNEVKLLVEIAYLYYEKRKKQSEIAKHFNISRSLVSLHLTKAREMGIVEITINDELLHPYHQLEQNMCETFSLTDVICVDTFENKEERKNRIAKAANRYLLRNLNNGDTVGIAGCTTINEMSNIISSSMEYPDVTFVSTTGGLGADSKDIQTNLICEKFAVKLQAKAKYLYTPVVLDSVLAKDILMQQSFIYETLDAAKSADVLLMGIGGTPDVSTLAGAYMHLIEMDKDENYSKIVGDIGYNFIDDEGELVDCEWNQRVINLKTDEFRKIPLVIAVAAGNEKVFSIFASLQARLLDTLITDEQTARELLKMNQSI